LKHWPKADLKKGMARSNLVATLLCAALGVGSAFYLPGVVPRQFPPNAMLPVKVNSLTSVKTHLPYDYYNLPFCRPDNIKASAENLGEILAGNKIESSSYQLHMDVRETCKVLCKKMYGKNDIEHFKEKIDEEYVVNWVVDNLPAAAKIVVEGEETVLYEHGYYLGGHMYAPGASPLDAMFSQEDITPVITAHYLNNHVSITIMTHSGDFEGKRVVNVEVEPKSIRHTHTDWKEQPKYMAVKGECENPEETMRPPMVIAGDDAQVEKDGNVLVVWTYSVQWEASPIRWASRWDIYLSMNNRYDDEVHWFAIINSLLIIFLLTGMVALIMMRTLRKDVLYYNRVLTEEERAEEKEESGWKLVHGDVFRPPAFFPMLFSVTVGTSTQLLGMAVVTLFFAAVGFLSPANRGSLVIASVSLFVLMGAAAGYAAARTYKFFGGKAWQQCILLTAFLFPGICFVLFFIVNLCVWHMGSSGAVPFGSMFAMLALWMGISVPLTFLGAYFGFRKPKADPATAVTQYPRAIPPQVWYLQPLVTVPVGGILPFGAVFVELFFILSSLWLDQFYYVYGFLVLVFAILMVTCAELTIVMIYFQLCAEDYRWWWRSFLTSGSCAFYMWCYSCFYFFTKLDMVLVVSAVVYFVYMWMICAGCFLLTGCVGYYTAFYFIHTIYGALKVD